MVGAAPQPGGGEGQGFGGKKQALSCACVGGQFVLHEPQWIMT